MKGEKRNRTRVPVHFTATARVGKEDLELETENISLSGMLCDANASIQPHETVEIRITLTPDIVITLEAEVLRSDREGLAFAFSSVDEEGFYHLKQLVQQNADDADQIDREILRHGAPGIKS